MANISKLLAKSRENGGQSLIEHCLESGRIAMKLAKNISTDETFVNSVTLFACLHDIGKATEGFQKYLNGQSECPKMQHNVVSATFLSNYLKCGDWCGNSESIRTAGVLSILYHHPCLNQESLPLGEIDENDIETIRLVCEEILSGYESLTGVKVSLSDNCNPISRYTAFSSDYYRLDNEEFIKCSSIVKTADIIASNGSDVNDYTGVNAPVTNFALPAGYDEDRFNKQVDLAKSVSGHKLSHIIAPAGYGKTLIGTIWGAMNGKKTWWVVPRNVIARSTYESVKKELKNLGLDGIKVGLLLGGEWENGDYNCNIIITNIDNIARPAINSDKNYMNYNIINDNIVFDEYQEYFTQNGSIMAAFLVLARTRMKLDKCGETLFRSATDVPNFWKDIVNVSDGDFVKCELKDCDAKMLDSRRRIFFVDEMPGKDEIEESTYVYTNSIQDCQNLFTTGYCERLFHSNYIDEDRKTIEESLYGEHGKEGDGKTNWVATYILSTGLDVSFDNLLIMSPTPDRTVQINGRGDRWNRSNEIVNCTFVRPNKRNISDRAAIDSFYTMELAEDWFEFLKSHIENGSVINLRRLYELRNEFMNSEPYAGKLKTLYKECKKSSFSNFSKLQYARSSKKEETDAKYIPKQGFRKNEDFQEFYCRVKYAGEDAYTTAFTTDTMRMNMDFLRSVRCVEDAVRYLDKSGEWKKYKSNKYQWDRFKAKDTAVKFDYFMNAARCSETPMIIPHDYEYDKVLGLVKVR